MNFDYRFPLFEGLTQGNLNPLSAQNAATADYSLRLAEQIVDPTPECGSFSVRFPRAVHPKQRYYLRLLINETNAYCAELISMLEVETDANIRAYLRDRILDKHLTSCLQRLGVHIKEAQLPVRLLADASICENTEDYYNAWVLHLLKACVAKAYLEVQRMLTDVVINLQTEAGLYCSYLDELPPVQTFLQKRKEETVTPANKAYTSRTESPALLSEPAIEPTAMDKDEFLLVEEVSKLLRIGQRTVLRRINSGEIKAIKNKGKWLIYKTALEKAIIQLKTNRK